MFANILQYPCYEKMVGAFSLVFSDLVIIGERVEMGIKLGRIIDNLPDAVQVRNPSVEEREKKTRMI